MHPTGGLLAVLLFCTGFSCVQCDPYTQDIQQDAWGVQLEAKSLKGIGEGRVKVDLQVTHCSITGPLQMGMLWSRNNVQGEELQKMVEDANAGKLSSDGKLCWGNSTVQLREGSMQVSCALGKEGMPDDKPYGFPVFGCSTNNTIEAYAPFKGKKTAEDAEDTEDTEDAEAAKAVEEVSEGEEDSSAEISLHDVQKILAGLMAIISSGDGLRSSFAELYDIVQQDLQLDIPVDTSAKQSVMYMLSVMQERVTREISQGAAEDTLCDTLQKNAYPVLQRLLEAESRL